MFRIMVLTEPSAIEISSVNTHFLRSRLGNIELFYKIRSPRRLVRLAMACFERKCLPGVKSSLRKGGDILVSLSREIAYNTSISRPTG